jgi:hypothetical protein
MDQILIDQHERALQKPMRVYAAKTQDEAVDCAVKRYHEEGWPLPDACYVIKRRICVEVYMPVTKHP